MERRGIGAPLMDISLNRDGRAGVASAAAPRLFLVDALRGAAIVGVVVFHFTWDLDITGFIPAGAATTPQMMLFARILAGTFLFVVGVSLVLAHGRAIRWRAFAKRLAVIAAAAAVITAGTWVAFPDAFVYFGILHAIVVTSLIGIWFVRMPVAVTLAAALAVWVLPLVYASPVFDTRWLAWLGLAELPPPSVDYAPVFPSLALTLLGVALARLAVGHGLAERLARYRPGGPGDGALQFLGRHTLVIYLVHQPILLGALVVLARLLG